MSPEEMLEALYWPASWQAFFRPDPVAVSAELSQYVAQEYAQKQVFPPQSEVFQAFQLTAPDAVKVVILGQDPYHNDGQAHGLAFSVNPGIKVPPSLRNIYRELSEDVGCEIPAHGDLRAWAKQGVLLMNTVLTVRAHEAASHQKKGWESLTDQVIQRLSEHHAHLVFILWGKAAQTKTRWIDESKHTVLQSVHPSPLSARRGFFGSRPFSQTNQALVAHGQSSINWCVLNEENKS